MENSQQVNSVENKGSSLGMLSGILFIVLGIFCVCYPILASVSIDIVIGISLLIGAIFAMFQMPQGVGAWKKLFYIILLMIYAFAGLILLMNPFEGTQALMVFFGFIFLSEGIFSLVYWNKLREFGHGSLILINAIISIILSVLILFNINMGIWFIGVLVGINFMFVGFSLVFSAPEESKV